MNWCPEMGTVLSNEEVVDGKSDIGGHPVVRMPLRQWLMRITAYAERLLDDLEPLNWSHSIKEMQSQLDRQERGGRRSVRVRSLESVCRASGERGEDCGWSGEE